MMRIRPRTPDYKNGILDPTSKVGRGLITEILVGKVLGNPEGQCNFVHKFNYKYDMYNPKYGTVDVKSSAFRNGRNYWSISNCDSNKVDTFVAVLFDNKWTNVEYVLILPSRLLTGKSSLTFSKSTIEAKYNKYMVDVEPYNNVYRNMNINNCPYMDD